MEQAQTCLGLPFGYRLNDIPFGGSLDVLLDEPQLDKRWRKEQWFLSAKEWKEWSKRVFTCGWKTWKGKRKKEKKKKEAKRVTLLGDFGSVRFVGLLVKVYIFLSLLQDWVWWDEKVYSSFG